MKFEDIAPRIATRNKQTATVMKAELITVLEGAELPTILAKANPLPIALHLLHQI